MTSAARRLMEGDGYLRLVEIFIRIRKSSLFTWMSHAKARELVESAALLETYKAGQAIDRAAGPVELRIVGAGKVGVYTRGRSPAKVTEIGEGRSLELAALFKGTADWQHDWIAETDCEVLRLPWERVSAVLRADPIVFSYLERTTVHPEIQRLKNDLRLFGVPPRDVARLIASAELTQDAARCAGPSFVVVKSGDLVVNVPAGPRLLRLDSVGAGNYAWLPALPAGSTVAGEGVFAAWVVRDEASTLVDWTAQGSAFLRHADRLSYKLERQQAAGQAPRRSPLERLRDTQAELPGGMPTSAPAPAQPAEPEPLQLTVEDFETGAAAAWPRRRRFEVVRQHDEMDCGAACLATIARHYRREISLAAFRGLVHVTKEGSSLLALCRAAEKVGFEALGAVASLTSLKSMQLPAIALLQYHFVVVYSVGETEVEIGDPGRGMLKVGVESFRREFSQNVLFLKPTERLYEYPTSRNSMTKYLRILSGNERDLARLFMLSIAMFVCGLAMPFASQHAVDAVVLERKTDTITVMALALLGFQLFNAGVGWVQGYLMAHFSSSVDAKFSCLFQRQVLSLPFSYFAVRRVGDFTSRFGELGKIRAFISQRPMGVLLSLFSVAVYGTVLGLIEPRLLAMVGCAVPLLAGIMLWSTPRLRAMQAELTKIGARNSSLMFEQLRSLETIRSLRAEIAARWRWETSVVEARQLGRRVMRFSTRLGAANGLLNSLFTSSIYLFAVSLFIDGDLTLGQVLSVSMLSGQVLGPTLGLISQANSVSGIKLSMDRIDDVMTSAVESTTAVESPVARLTGKIELRDVCFRYGTEQSPLILDEVTLTIEPGSTVAFVGASGSGKTTLAFLINMLYQPTRGAILVDDRPLDAYPLAFLRRQVAMVMQDTALFRGSVLENIALGDPAPDFARVVAAARHADAHGFITSLKQGYSTVLAESGAGLSGGQRQRLNIARAFYLDPPLLILDEATSALDSVSERVVMGSVRGRGERRTTVIIAHRLNTVMNAERIFVLDRGRVVEAGAHGELMDRRGLYFNMFRRQTMS